ncbi:MAG: response regulator [Lachnospiraceae bacterium]|nr:response regulator [Lachnospiraceae bacterium]
MGDLIKKANILIVDDVSANLTILAEMVRELGYVPRPVSSVKQAQSAIEQILPSLILLDITMPEMTGFEFCEILKANAKTRDIPVIFISALTSKEDKIKGFELGAVDYIERPFEKAEVSMRINTHLKNFRFQQELENYNQRLHKLISEQMNKILLEQKHIIKALAILSEIKDDNTRNHLDNISSNCKLIATCLQLSPKFEKEVTNEFVENIEIAATLHDIGKLTVPDYILLKPGVLETKEMEEVKKHSRKGYEVLKSIAKSIGGNAIIDMGATISLSHHERWDGKGYPDNLKGEEIPLCARIMAIADAYDTLTGSRCYRESFTHEQTMQIIQKESGRAFDPDIVDIVVKVQKQLKGDQR